MAVFITSAGQGRKRPGTNGAASGPNGWASPSDLAAGWLAILALLAAATVVNAMTVQADRPSIEAWAPWVLEGSSAAVLALLAWAPGWTIAAMPPEDLSRGWPARCRFLAGHLGAALGFSLLHVVGMVLLRQAVYAAAGEVYRNRPSGVFLYEFRKDVLTYTIFAAVFWLARHLRQRSETVVRPVSFDIRDGARLIRAPLGDILAATSAGNYVEFVLADGRRPLMRATLATIEAELGRFGFVRTHRSWLVNAGRMTGLRPEGSGDWTVELGPQTAPLSRRYADALRRLQGDGAA